MTIAATCVCGATFKAKPELAGRNVNCPKCGQTFTVPKPEPEPEPSQGALHLTCVCGKKLHANPEMAGKKLKCPACGQPLTILKPDGAPEPTDLEIIDESTEPGALGGDPFSQGMTASANPLGAARPAQAQTTPAKKSFKRKKKQSGLVTAAGIVAIVYGSYQALVCSVAMLHILIVIVKTGFVSILVGITPVLKVLLLALGIWLIKLGVDIVRREKPREALERAAQASMVYIALVILGLIMSVIGLLSVLSSAPGGAASAMVFVTLAFSILLQLIYTIPPGFIIYVDSQQKP